MEFIKKFLKAIKPVSQEELNEKYLNEATSLEDLEWRMRKIDRESFNRIGNFPSGNSF